MRRFRSSCAGAKYHPSLCLPFVYSVVYNKKGKRKVQGVKQSQTAALPRYQEEEETDTSKQAQIEQTFLLPDNEDPDQTAQTCKLIWAFIFRICLKTRFRMARPFYLFTYLFIFH